MGSRPFIDYLYQNSASVDGQWNGIWGLLRVYNGRAGLKNDLLRCPTTWKARRRCRPTTVRSRPIRIVPNGVTDYKDTTDASVSS